MTDPRRDQLLGWISKTRQTQRRFAVVIAVLFGVSVALFAWSTGIGTLAFFLTAITGISGYWITSSHIVDWNHRLADLATHGKKLHVSGGGKRF
jgi:hypothetical protein